MYQGMRKSDPLMPAPHILLHSLQPIPSLYLHEPGWVFEDQILGEATDYTHIISYLDSIPEFKVLLSSNYEFFDIPTLRSVSIPKVYVHQRIDIIYTNPESYHSKCRPHP